MHRTYRVPRLALFTALFSLLAIVGERAGHAQQGPPPAPPPAVQAQPKAGTTVVVPINGSQVLEMAKKQRIKSIDNTDQNVARVEFVQGSDFRQVMILGGAQAGISKLTLTDENNNQEVYTILVELNTEFLRRVIAQTAPTANIQILQGTGGTVILKGTVAHAADIDVIVRAAAGAIGDPARVINALEVGGVQMVQLDVVIARVARSEARSMGFSFLQTRTTEFLRRT